jgi:hypothetical protein
MKWIVTIIMGALCLAPSVTAAPPQRPAAGKPTRANPADKCELHGITWHRNLEYALQQAKTDRPVLLLRVLGELDGFM